MLRGPGSDPANRQNTPGPPMLLDRRSRQSASSAHFDSVIVSSTLTLDTDDHPNLLRQSTAAGGTGVLETDDLEGSHKGPGIGYS